jgi:large subunit ribosomal protein L21
MYAIIKTGGKQYTVKKGSVIDVELLDANPGDNVQFEVLCIGNGDQTQVGNPILPNQAVFGEVVGLVHAEKITSLKYKRSHNQCRRWGHRQKNTRLKITDKGIFENQDQK